MSFLCLENNVSILVVYDQHFVDKRGGFLQQQRQHRGVDKKKKIPDPHKEIQTAHMTTSN